MKLEKDKMKCCFKNHYKIKIRCKMYQFEISGMQDKHAYTEQKIYIILN